MCGHHHRHHQRTARVAAEPRHRADDPTRASDAEREEVVSALRHHAGEGRLSVEELDRRAEAALGATTRSDLAALTQDLPRAPRRQDPRAARAELREHVRTYLAVMALLVVIWALTGAGYLWPVWPALGWGIGVVSHAASLRRLPGARARATLPA